ncbi:aldo/keto reductase [Nonomuraea angiospora]|uniref:Aryl-alcohol dehydrogenase-like predicted oxidoreductase n=1 Tax=Nonomuraea angiospora TaxID=46172 RepID=A0ABR9LRQ5_9ACTN|nr:aldo/keto reductase [Nonomuraea angiospora]MBE1583343.1 aryl-alcohol dehydrogenase-like predicted oxidoreductase [Nonomuraea angiospora]
MRYRTLGDSGLRVSVVGLGCNNIGSRIDVARTREVVDAAIEEGVTLFDTAEAYGASEEILGEVLAGRRDQVVLATKFGRPGDQGAACGTLGGRSYIRRAVEGSLRRLRTDYIDLYQYHFPDGVTPIEETLEALTELVREGKVRYLGSSNFAGWQIAEAAHVARARGCAPFVSAQNHWSLLERGAEREVVPAARHYGVGVLPYFPLANGLLTGKVRRGQEPPAGSRLAERPHLVTPEKLDRVEALTSWADKHDRSLLDVAIGALAALPGCGSVIAGATSPEQVRANAAAGGWEPTAEELSEITGLVPA